MWLPLSEIHFEYKADSIISEGSSLPFVSELERRLSCPWHSPSSPSPPLPFPLMYESLCFLTLQAGILLGVYRALLERYAGLQSQLKDKSISVNGFQYFNRIRVIPEYFGSAAGCDGVICKFMMASSLNFNSHRMLSERILVNWLARLWDRPKISAMYTGILTQMTTSSYS